MPRSHCKHVGYPPVRADERGTLQGSTRVSVVQGTAFRPIEGVRPQTAYALVPRDRDAPTLLLVRADDGTLRSILTDGSRTGVAFPFPLPEQPGEATTRRSPSTRATGRSCTTSPSRWSG